MTIKDIKNALKTGQIVEYKWQDANFDDHWLELKSIDEIDFETMSEFRIKPAKEFYEYPPNESFEVFLKQNNLVKDYFDVVDAKIIYDNGRAYTFKNGAFNDAKYLNALRQINSIIAEYDEDEYDKFLNSMFGSMFGLKEKRPEDLVKEIKEILKDVNGI